MKLRLAVVTAALVLSASGLLLAQSDPFSGTWKLSQAKSKYTSGAPPKQETVIIERTRGQDQVNISGVGADGSPLSIKYALPVKGGTGKILAGGPYDGVSGKTVNDNSRQLSYMKGGQEALHVNVEVSKDGKTMSGTVKGTDAQGKPVSGVSVFEKQ
jgi:hypothetical protein